MTKKALPTLDQKGWVTDPVTLGAKILLYAIRSEKGQSADFDDDIVSLPSLVVLYGNKPSEMSFQTKTVLEKLFNKYFSLVKVDVKELESEETSQYTIQIDIMYGDTKASNSLGYNVFVSPETNDVRGTIEKYNG